LSDSPLQLFLVRHGETEWSRDKRHTGRTDIPLTERGEEEARAVAPLLEGREFARVVASPLTRALETCRLAGLGKGVETDDNLLEWDYGSYDGITTAQIHETRPDWVLWRDGCPGGESPAQVGARADAFLADVADIAGDVAVFAHGHMLRVVAARWLELEPAAGARFALGTGTLSILGWEHDWHVFRTWNSRST
jgi:broad specificity phosphatase PhoE